MKKLIWLLIIVVLVSAAFSQDTSFGKSWKATVKVVDQLGQPIPDAEVTIGYYVAPPEGQTIAMSSRKGKTDTNGLFFASGQTTSTDLFFGAGKGGYYRAHLDHEFAEFRDQDPAKWNPTVTLLLKEVINPVPMYAKFLMQEPPVLNQPVGFDFIAGDWAAPHGKGQVKDIIITKTYRFLSSSDYEANVSLTFSNPADGIQVFAPSPLETSSSFRSTYEAPQDGYQPELTRENNAHPGQPTKFEFDPNRIYFLRVRSVLDEKGKMKSALYGKIYGDFMQFRYFLNPTPNDRNVEFNLSKNLLQNVKPFERVSEP